jgi:hypothetical protein
MNRWATQSFGARATCHFVAESGGDPVVTSHADFVPGSRCAGVLASGRLAAAKVVHYIAKFKADTGQEAVRVISAVPDGKVAAETALARQINRAEATHAVKIANEMLAKLLR